VDARERRASAMDEACAIRSLSALRNGLERADLSRYIYGTVYNCGRICCGLAVRDYTMDGATQCMLVLAAFLIVLGFVALLCSKIYIMDQGNGKATEVNLPLVGKMKTNSCASLRSGGRRARNLHVESVPPVRRLPAVCPMEHQGPATAARA